MGAAPPKPPRIVTKQQFDAAVAGWQGQHAGDSNERGFFSPHGGRDEELQAFKDSMSVLPPPAPDLADQTIQRARMAARRRLLMGGLTGPLDLTGASLTKPPPGLTGI